MVDPKQRQPDPSKQKNPPGSFTPRDNGRRPKVGQEAGAPNDNNFKPKAVKTQEQIVDIYNLGKNLIRALSGCETVLDVLNKIPVSELDDYDKEKLSLINQRTKALDKALLREKGLDVDEMLQIDLAIKKVALDIVRLATKNNFSPTDADWENVYKESLSAIKNFALENEILGTRELATESVQESGALVRSIGQKILRPGIFVKPAFTKQIENLRQMKDMADDMELLNVDNIKKRVENYGSDVEEASTSLELVQSALMKTENITELENMTILGLEKILEKNKELQSVNKISISFFKELLTKLNEYSIKFSELDASARAVLTPNELKLITAFEKDYEEAKKLIQETITSAEKFDRGYSDVEETVENIIKTKPTAGATAPAVATVASAPTMAEAERNLKIFNRATSGEIITLNTLLGEGYTNEEAEAFLDILELSK